MDQLEVIYADGQIEFYDLDPAKSMINIGQNGDNDIVLVGANIGPVHAMLDCRQQPYQLMLLNENGAGAILDGTPLIPHKFYPLYHWNALQIEGHTLILVEGAQTIANSSAPVAAPIPIPSSNQPTFQATLPTTQQPPTEPITPQVSHPNTSATPLPTTRPEATNFTPIAGVGLAAAGVGAGIGLSAAGAIAPAGSAGPVWSELPADHQDDWILLTVDEKDWAINVDEYAEYRLTIANHGPRVATLSIRVEGLDPSWVPTPPSSINLFDGGQDTILLTIAPPRLPSSRAGTHHFAVIVESPNYPGRYSQLGLTLVINPYYTFGVNELSPKKRKISWFRQDSMTHLTVINHGNSVAGFVLEGRDDERSCSYEFDVPGEATILTQQAPLQLEPESYSNEAANNIGTIPIRVTPRSRPLFLRKKTHRFIVSVTPQQGQQGPLALPGELAQGPLLGFFPLLLLTLLFLFLCVLLLRPSITTFTLNQQVGTTQIEAGEEVALEWEASYFSQLRLETDTDDPIERPEDTSGRIIVEPSENTEYTLTAENLLSAVIPFLEQTEARRVLVNPIFPLINEFTTSKNDIITGEEIILSWSVAEAENVTLFSNDIPESIPTTEYANGQRVVSPNENTVYRLEAANQYGTPQSIATVLVSTPTGTPIPTPDASFFTVSSPRILQGQPVTLNWQVTGADTVTINPIGPVPPDGPISHSPQETTLYTLLAVKEGAPSVNLVREVIVDVPTGTPTATATPAAPEIIEFNASKIDLVVGDGGDDTSVTLFWTVQGETTDIQLANSANVVIQSQLDIEGQLDVAVDENSTFFTLIALNGEKSNRKSVTLNVATPTPTGTPLPTATATPIPPEITEFVIVSPDAPQVVDLGGDNPHIYEVQKGTTVTFQWRTNNATTKVIFTEPGGIADVGTVPVGQVDREINSTGNLNYTLVGENAEGDSTTPQQIQIQVINPQPPDPPFNVTGTEESANDRNIIKWNWSFVPGQSDITGFRIYRTDVPPGGDFSLIKEVLDENARETIDEPLTQTCGKGYYIVALYEDVNGATQESATSTTSWFSSTCP